jgi:hypothetical protein
MAITTSNSMSVNAMACFDLLTPMLRRSERWH